MSLSTRRLVAIGLVLGLAVLHHDFWLWESDSLVLGFLPVGLAYHASFSLFAGLIWAVVVFLVWPEDEELESGEET